VENILRHTAFGDTKKSFMETIAVAAHEVQRPVFFARVIIIVAYLPIFTLQRVEGRLFRPMAWTVAFALLGALIFALLVAPVLCSMLFKGKIKEWRNPVLDKLNRAYASTLDWCFDHMKLTLGAGLLGLALMIFLAFSGIIGSEFLPHLDEGAIWVRGTLAPSTGPTAGFGLANRARLVLANFPEVKQVVSQVGRPDDGSDASGFYNTEFFVDLLPRSKWRKQFPAKDDLIAAMDKALGQFPGRCVDGLLGLGCLSLQLSLGLANLQPGRFAGGVQSGVALCIPLLHSLFARLVNLGARLAKLGCILGCLGFGQRNRLVRIFHSAFGACPAFLQCGR